MKLKILLLLTLTLSLMSYSQTCGTSEQRNNSSVSKTVTHPNYLKSNTPICINIKYHILRNSSGNGGYDTNNLSLITAQLNQTLNPHNLYVVELGFDFIDNSNLNIIDTDEEFNQLVQINNSANAINIYLIQDSTLDWVGQAVEILSNAYVIENNYATSFISSHEFGHCIDLYHTFQGTKSNTVGCPEEINGSNCETCGDEVCDTPADADIGNSGGYSPDITNLMSYYFNSDHFTTGQIDRSRLAFATSSLLQQTVSSSCAAPEIIGDEHICMSNNETYSVINNDSNVSAWVVSPNIMVISFTSNSITVEQLNNSSSYGWIEAHVDEIIIRKDVFVGKPLVTTNGIIGGHDNAAVNTTSQFNVDWAIGNSHYYWTVTPNTTCSNGSGPTIQPTNSNTYNSTSRYAYINWGACAGTFAVACFARNECGDEWIGTKWVTVYDPYDNNDNPCPNGPIELKTYPNPIAKGGSLVVSKLAPGYPCNDSPFGKKGISITNIVEIYNLQGKQVFSKVFKTDEFKINNLNLRKGIYILNVTATDGFNEKKRIVIE